MQRGEVFHIGSVTARQQVQKKRDVTIPLFLCQIDYTRQRSTFTPSSNKTSILFGLVTV